MSIDRTKTLTSELEERDIVPFIGIYDVLSASLAARHFDALFVSGLGFAASHFGLPDVGFATWTDITAFVQRLRLVVPDHLLLVDIDDGYGDDQIASQVVIALEQVGASAVVLEDQKRPRKCGHLDGKELLELDEYAAKLKRVLDSRREMFVVARTDASESEEMLLRAATFEELGADAVLVDGVRDVGFLRELRSTVTVPLAFNQIAGGKSPSMTFQELADQGVNLAIYSTPALFAAHSAVVDELVRLKESDGWLVQPEDGGLGLTESTAILNENLQRSLGD